VPSIPPGAFKAGLAVHPKVVSLALDDPGDLVRLAHDAGALVMHQVTTVAQAIRAAERGVDIIIAQGSEAGGQSGTVGLFPLLPQVVDAVRPLPVVAAGGIFDGRGLAAALALGAVGVNVGTRFLASEEARLGPQAKQMILSADSEDVIKADVLNDIGSSSLAGIGYGTTGRYVSTPFLAHWQANRSEAKERASELRQQIEQMVSDGRRYEAFGPSAGQSAGGISELLPVAEIIRQMVASADDALNALSSLRITRPR
jgi:nitronate monooxygenase/enoyl-[acyl-carrier protein] reductase II